jgi:hypothetical protein
MKPIPALISNSKKTCPNKPVFFGFVEKSENAQNRQKTAGKKIRRHMTRIRGEKRAGGGKANFLEGSEMKVRMRNFQANRETKALCIYFVKKWCHGENHGTSATVAMAPRDSDAVPNRCQITIPLKGDVLFGIFRFRLAVWHFASLSVPCAPHHDTIFVTLRNSLQFNNLKIKKNSRKIKKIPENTKISRAKMYLHCKKSVPRSIHGTAPWHRPWH